MCVWALDGVRLWELQTIHNPLRLFGGSTAHGGAPVLSTKFSFTGDRVLSMGMDQVVRLWNFEGECVAKWVQTDVRATAVAMDVRGEMVRRHCHQGVRVVAVRASCERSPGHAHGASCSSRSLG